MATYSDAFAYSNGELNSVSSGVWVDIGLSNDINVASGQLDPQGGSNSHGYRYNQTFNSKHYSILQVVTGGLIGPAIRMGAGPDMYYCFAEATATTYVGEMDDGSPVDWDGGQSSPDTGETAELWVDESVEGTIYYKVEGVTIETYTSKTTLSGGSAGICAYDFAGALGDNWEGGDVGGGAGRTTHNTVSNPLGLHTAIGWRINNICNCYTGFVRKIVGYFGQRWSWLPMKKSKGTLLNCVNRQRKPLFMAGSTNRI